MSGAARILLIDNHDSYTYNLFQLFAAVSGVEPDVVTNDDPHWAHLDLGAYTAAVVSPGPGRPDRTGDFAHSADVFRARRLPVLGVCLGHQGLGEAAGARVVAAPRPRHGHTETITHDGDELFAGIPRAFTAVRYHSLCLAEPLPAELAVTARAVDGVVMGVRHRELPWWGVQFHPESVASEYGERLAGNFLRLASGAASGSAGGVGPTRVGAAIPVAPREPAPGAAPLLIRSLVLEREVDTAAVFDRLYRDRDPVFWLDSARVDVGVSRFSFLGDASGPRGEVLEYGVGHGQVTVHPSEGTPTAEPGTIFDVLTRRLRERTVAETATNAAPHTATEADTAAAGAHRDDLPFDFRGGYVGYLGYELKADCGAHNRHMAPGHDAQWLFCDRFIAVDHVDKRTHVVALHGDEGTAGADAWLAATAHALRRLPDASRDLEHTPARVPAPQDITGDASVTFGRSAQRYRSDIDVCLDLLALGETYEVCLTDTATVPAPADPIAFHRRLRAGNPAPYGALLRFGGAWVAGASPERFLRVDRHRVAESRPIKGTARRDADPRLDDLLRASLANDAKTRAENLMIVDLLRNDLGRVCEVGSIEVPAFLTTETYATVHQLVSTVRGRLREDVDAVACARACFPGGSMTGAPKPRTMEIIDHLETGPRGVYSGALGYFSACGAADLSVVIRTAVLREGTMTVGAGGAIVLDSDPEQEYAEMLLKAETTLRALIPEAEPVPFSSRARPRT